MTTTADYSWAVSLVERIHAGDNIAVEELYAIFTKGIRFYVAKNVHADEIWDVLHDAFIIVLQSIQKGVIRDPQRIMGYCRTVVRLRILDYIEKAVKERLSESLSEAGNLPCESTITAEEIAIQQDNDKLVGSVLNLQKPLDRDILERFYFAGQKESQITRELHLTSTQFRLRKSRAKARFGEMGKRMLRRRAA